MLVNPRLTWCLSYGNPIKYSIDNMQIPGVIIFLTCLFMTFDFKHITFRELIMMAGSK